MTPLKVAYITMRFPVASETFACNDIRALKCKGLDVTVQAYRSAPVDSATLLSERGLDDLTISLPGRQSFVAVVAELITHPGTVLSLLGWHIARNLTRPVELIKGFVLIPRSLAIFRNLRQDPPDVVHLFWGHYPSQTGYLVSKYLPGTVLSHFIGAYDLNSRYGGIDDALQRADVVWTHSASNLPDIRAYGVDECRIKVAHRGVDLAKVEEARVPESERVAKRIVTAGRLVPGKGVEKVMTLFQTLLKSHPETSLVILGDGPERTALEASAREMGLDERIRFAGHVPQSELFAELGRADIFLFLSTKASERLPNVVKEAMLSGCVNIVSQTKGIGELVENGQDGFIVDPENGEMIVQIADSLFNGERDVSSIRDAAVAKIRDRFDLDRCIDMQIDVWTECRREKN